MVLLEVIKCITSILLKFLILFTVCIGFCCISTGTCRLFASQYNNMMTYVYSKQYLHLSNDDDDDDDDRDSTPWCLTLVHKGIK